MHTRYNQPNSYQRQVHLIMHKDGKNLQREHYWHLFVNSDSEENRAESFSSLYRLFVNELMAYGRGLGFETVICEDGVHDVFCTLYSHRKQLKDVTDITAYLFKSFRNTLLNTYKQNAHISDVETVQIHFSTEVNVTDTLISEEQRQDVAETVARLLEVLTDRQREAIYLRYMHGMDYHDIALLMNMHPDSVRKIVYRAMTTLREKGKQLHNPLLSALITYWLVTS